MVHEKQPFAWQIGTVGGMSLLGQGPELHEVDVRWALFAKPLLQPFATGGETTNF